MTEHKYFVEMVDKWTKRRFALRLENETQFDTVGNYIEFVRTLSDTDIAKLVEEGRLGERGVAGLEDIRTLIFNLDDKGEFANLIGTEKEKIGDEVLDTRVRFNHASRKVRPTTKIKFKHQKTAQQGSSDIYVAQIKINRDNVNFALNWDAFYARAWKRNPHFKEFVEGVVDSAHGSRAAEVLALGSRDAKIDFIKAIANAVHAAPYELYSRFLGRMPRFKTGPETLECIMNGKGGNCSEKASALDFIAHAYGLESGFVFSGDMTNGTFPEKELKEALYNWNFEFKMGVQKYWEHFANWFSVDGTPVLVDATGGYLPHVFAVGDEATALFTQKKGIKATFVTQGEEYFYHKAPDDMAYDQLWALNAWEPHIDIHHVFGPQSDDPEEMEAIWDPFGVLITDNLWILPQPYVVEADFTKESAQWKKWAESQREKGVTGLETYTNLDPSADKKILTALESNSQRLVADLRAAGPNIADRYTQFENDKNTNWRMYWVFATMDRK